MYVNTFIYQCEIPPGVSVGEIRICVVIPLRLITSINIHFKLSIQSQVSLSYWHFSFVFSCAPIYYLNM